MEHSCMHCLDFCVRQIGIHFVFFLHSFVCERSCSAGHRALRSEDSLQEQVLSLHCALGLALTRQADRCCSWLQPDARPSLTPLPLCSLRCWSYPPPQVSQALIKPVQRNIQRSRIFQSSSVFNSAVMVMKGFFSDTYWRPRTFKGKTHKNVDPFWQTCWVFNSEVGSLTHHSPVLLPWRSLRLAVLCVAATLSSCPPVSGVAVGPRSLSAWS